jgi:RNA polymerase sigma-70 factor (sigma-E family)
MLGHDRNRMSVQGNGEPERLEEVHDSAPPADGLDIEDLQVVEPLDRAGTERLAGAPGDDTPPGPCFGEFYAVTYPEMVRLAYLLTGSAETACDLVQDCYLRVHGKWKRIDDPKAYLRRAVVNACNSHHRRARRQREHARTLRVEPVVLGADEMADAIAALPYRQRAAIVLRFWHDCSEAEIATALGCRPGTVGSLIHRAVAELRRVIA